MSIRSGFGTKTNSNGTSHRSCSLNKVFLKTSQNSQENICARFSYLLKLQKALTQMFPCEFCEIFKKLLFTEHFRETTFYEVSVSILILSVKLTLTLIFSQTIVEEHLGLCENVLGSKTIYGPLLTLS